jgi:DNA processing protein
MSDLSCWLWLSLCKDMTAAGAQKYLRRFGTAKGVYYAPESDLRQVEGAAPKEVKALLNRNMDRVQRVQETCAREGVRILCLQDADYPERLRNIPDPPTVLYVQGTLPLVDDRITSGVVGTRRASAYGKEMADTLGRGLAEAGAVVVTGLAEGIDSAAAKGALRGHGSVIAVLGTSTDKVYPSWNTKLQDAVAKLGALVSEYPPGTGPTRASFPMRNRIISGLCLGVTVVQAPPRSGSLITAARAQEQGRDVFVVPGMANDPNFAGSHALIRDGAQLVCTAEDILEDYRFRYPRLVDMRRKKAESKRPFQKYPNLDKPEDVGYHALKEQLKELSEAEIQLVGLLVSGPKHSDDLIAAADREAGEVLTTLTMLQLKGYVQEENRVYRLVVS